LKCTQYETITRIVLFSISYT